MTRKHGVPPSDVAKVFERMCAEELRADTAEAKAGENDTPLQQMFVRMDQARFDLNEMKIERDEARAQLHALKGRLFRMDASVATSRMLLEMARSPEVLAAGNSRALALKLGEAVLNSPFCTINQRHSADGEDLITQVAVTLFKPKKLGSKED